MTKTHPSGRPVRLPGRVRPAWDRFGESGFRLERLRPGHIRQSIDTFAIGFIDHRVGEDGDHDMRRRP